MFAAYFVLLFITLFEGHNVLTWRKIKKCVCVLYIERHTFILFKLFSSKLNILRKKTGKQSL